MNKSASGHELTIVNKSPIRTDKYADSDFGGGGGDILWISWLAFNRDEASSNYIHFKHLKERVKQLFIIVL